MVAILSSLLVSYARARAEGLGLDCKVGIAQRAERILGLGVASLLVGAGPNALVLEGIVAILAVASIITVIQRFVYVYQTADGLENPPGAGTVQPPASARPVERAPLDTLAKGR
jgi:CDP-diacylglycerol--glycerol-3-phosphate 3-phosphatidyltransferase